MEEEKLELLKKPLIFRVDNDDVDTGLFVDLLDNNLESYLKSRHWGMDKLEDFRNRYNLIRGKLLNGDISGRGYDRSYSDSRNELTKDNTTSEVLYYLDRVLGARKKKNVEEKPKAELKYDRNFFAREFSDYFFNGNPETNLEAWELGDYDVNTGVYSTTNRKYRSDQFLEHLKTKVNNNSDALRRINNLQTAIKESKDFSDIADEAAAFGMSKDTIDKLFRMKRLSEKNELEIPLPPELKYATEEQKLWYINEVKAGRAGLAAAFIEDLKKKKEAAEKEIEWNKTDWGKYNPELKSQTLFGFKDRNEDDNEDFQDIYDNGWKDLDDADYQSLTSQFTNDLLSYGLNPEQDLDTSSYYNTLLKGKTNFRENNRKTNLGTVLGAAAIGAGTGAAVGSAVPILGTAAGAGAGGLVSGLSSMLFNDETYDKADWTKKHFVNNYRALVKRGGSKRKNAKSDLLMLNGNEYYILGMWDPKNFVFYTYDYLNHAIIKHRISDSPVMLERWREEYYNKQKVDKKQEGGIFAQKTVPTEISIEDLDNKLQNSIDRELANKRELEDDFLFEDGARLAAMGADIASMVASFIPGYGTAAAGILGIGSTTSSLIADITDDSVSAGEVFSNLGANLGMTALGMIPGGKAPKIFKVLKTWIPRFIATYGSTKILLNPEVRKSFEKIVSSDSSDNLTVNDWKNIGYGISSVAGLTRAGTSYAKANKFKPKVTNEAKVRVTLTDGSKSEVTLTKDNINALNLAGKEGNNKAQEVFNSIISNKYKDDSKLKAAKLDFNFEDKSMLNTLTFGKLGNKSLDTTPITKDVNNAHHRRIIDLLNLEAINKGSRFRLSNDYEIFHDGKGFIQNVNPTGYFDIVGNLLSNKNAESQASAKEALIKKLWDERKLNNARRAEIQSKWDKDRIEMMLKAGDASLARAEIKNLNAARKLFPEISDMKDAELKAFLQEISPNKPLFDVIGLLDLVVHSNVPGNRNYGRSLFDLNPRTRKDRIVKALNERKSVNEENANRLKLEEKTKAKAEALLIKNTAKELRKIYPELTKNLSDEAVISKIELEIKSRNKKYTIKDILNDKNAQDLLFNSGKNGIRKAKIVKYLRKQSKTDKSLPQNWHKKDSKGNYIILDNAIYNKYEKLKVPKKEESGVYVGESRQYKYQPAVGKHNIIAELRELKKNLDGGLTKDALLELKKLGIDFSNKSNNNLSKDSKRIKSIKKALGLKESDEFPFKKLFEGSDNTLYYWKKGGVIKAQEGTKLFGQTFEDSGEKQPNYISPDKFSKRNELSRLLIARNYNDLVTKDKIASLRKNHVNSTALLLPETPIMKPTDFGTTVAVNLLQNSTQETSDATNNFLQLLEINLRVGDLWALDKIKRNQQMLDLIAHKTAERQKLAELNHVNAEENKRNDALLGAEIDNARMARDYKNWMAIDNYLKDISILARLKELAGEKAAYDLFVNLELLKMLDALEPMLNEYNLWKNDPNNANKSALEWEKYNEFTNLRKQLQRLAYNNTSRYQALYFGIPYKPIDYNMYYEHDFPLWDFRAYKTGGKIDTNKKSLEIAKMLLKDILELVKRSEKKLERLEKLTKKAKKK